MNWFKALFKNKKKQLTRTITCGLRDENGFCDSYINGEKTNIRMLIFTDEEANELLNLINPNKL